MRAVTEELPEVSLDLLAQALRVSGLARLRVTGGCMGPLLRSGDQAEVGALAPAGLTD